MTWATQFLYCQLNGFIASLVFFQPALCMVCPRDAVMPQQFSSLLFVENDSQCTSLLGVCYFNGQMFHYFLIFTNWEKKEVFFLYSLKQQIQSGPRAYGPHLQPQIQPSKFSHITNIYSLRSQTVSFFYFCLDSRPQTLFLSESPQNIYIFEVLSNGLSLLCSSILPSLILYSLFVIFSNVSVMPLTLKR